MKTARYAFLLQRRYRTIAAYVGLILSLAGVLVASPVLIFFSNPEESHWWWALLGPSAVLIIPGWFAWKRCAPSTTPVISLSEGAAIVFLSWLIAIMAASLPFVCILDLTWTQAIFESTSGWTTTGLSVVDVTTAPRVILLLRSVLELAGGAGLAIVMVSVMTGPSGPGLSTAEGRGEQLVPNVAQSAKLVVSLYIVYALFGTVALWLAGMSWFDAINHAFAAVSTGGFSTRPESIGYWDSVPIEAVTLLLMILGTMNFVTAYAVFRGQYRVAFRNGELRLMAVLIPITAFVVLMMVTLPLYASVGKALRVAIFETVSALSTTGFSTVSYEHWHDEGPFILMILMLIGGGLGSTAGGIKQGRIYLMHRLIIWEFRRYFLPRGAVNLPYFWEGSEIRFVKGNDMLKIAAFIAAYLGIFALGSSIIAMHGYPLRDALFEMASSLGTVGLSVGVTAAHAPPSQLWTQIAGMFLGRLEIFTVLAGAFRIIDDFFFRH